MFNPKVMEAWFTLMAEAMRGTKETQEAFRSLSDMSSNPEDFNRWVAEFMPSAASSFANPQPDALEAQMEEWWRMMGVVPRSRYLELLEKCDSLQRRLEKAEKTIQKLRTDAQEPQEQEAKKVLDTWSSMMQETLKIQTEWMKAWTAANTQSTAGELEGETETKSKESEK